MEKVPLKRVFLIKHTSNILVHDVINLLYIYIYICIYIIYNIYIYIYRPKPSNNQTKSEVGGKICQNIKPPTPTHIPSSVQLSTWGRLED